MPRTEAARHGAAGGREERGKGPASILRTATEDPNLQLWMSLALSSGQRRGGVGLGGSLQLVMLGELAGGSWGASLAKTYKKQTLMILLRIADGSYLQTLA